MLSLFLASVDDAVAVPRLVAAVLAVLVDGLAAVREVAEDALALEAEEAAVGLVTPLGRVIGLIVSLGITGDVFFSVEEEPIVDDRRSAEDVTGDFTVLAEVASTADMRFAVTEIPFFSSPELATDLVFSSAELALAEGRERCEEDVVELLSGLRVEVVAVVEEVVDGRVGGLERVLTGRASGVLGFVDEVRFRVAVLPACGCFTGVTPDTPFLAGE